MAGHTQYGSDSSKDLNFGDEAWSKSRIRRREPVMWLPYPPYRETGAFAQAKTRGGLCAFEKHGLARFIR